MSQSREKFSSKFRGDVRKLLILATQQSKKKKKYKQTNKQTNKQIHSIQQNKQELIFTFEKVEPETSCLIIIHPIKIANIVDSWLIYEPTTGFNTTQIKEFAWI